MGRGGWVEGGGVGEGGGRGDGTEFAEVGGEVGGLFCYEWIGGGGGGGLGGLCRGLWRLWGRIGGSGGGLGVRGRELGGKVGDPGRVLAFGSFGSGFGGGGTHFGGEVDGERG